MEVRQSQFIIYPLVKNFYKKNVEKNEAKANKKQTLFPNRIKIIEISLIRLNINTTLTI